MRRNRRWLVGLLLAVVLCLARFPWLNSDGGNSAFWSYAFFVTDEHMYTAGGRLEILTSHFLDPEMSEPPTFLGSWGMHFVSYLGYRFAGLTPAAARWPVAILAVGGWLAAYAITSRRTPALIAGTTVLLISCNPVSLTFERVASTDVVIGSLAIIAYLLATGRVAWPAGAVMALAASVKPTALPLCVLIALAMLARRDYRRLGLVSIVFGVTFGLLWIGRQACLQAAGNTDATLRELSRGYQTLSQLNYDPSVWARAASIFPRWPIAHHLGALAPWICALPVWIVLLERRGKFLTPTTAVALGLLLYLLPFATQPFHPLRYFIPATYFLPALLLRTKIAGNYQASALPALLGGIAVCFVLYWLQPGTSDLAGWFRANIYNELTLPAQPAWSTLFPRLFVGVMALGIALWFATIRKWLVPAGLALSFGWLFFNGFTLAPLTTAREFVWNQILWQLGLAILLAFLLWNRRRVWWLLALGFLFLVHVVGNPSWNKAYRELWTPRYYVRDASEQLTSILPPRSMVIGRRAGLLLRNTPLRLGLGSFAISQSEFVERVSQLLTRYPDRPLFWLIDGDGCPTWGYYLSEGRDKWNATPVTTVAVPSGDTLLWKSSTNDELALVPVDLVRITAK